MLFCSGCSGFGKMGQALKLILCKHHRAGAGHLWPLGLGVSSPDFKIFAHKKSWVKPEPRHCPWMKRLDRPNGKDLVKAGYWEWTPGNAVRKSLERSRRTVQMCRSPRLILGPGPRWEVGRLGLRSHGQFINNLLSANGNVVTASIVSQGDCAFVLGTTVRVIHCPARICLAHFGRARLPSKRETTKTVRSRVPNSVSLHSQPPPRTGGTQYESQRWRKTLLGRLDVELKEGKRNWNKKGTYEKKERQWKVA